MLKQDCLLAFFFPGDSLLFAAGMIMQMNFPSFQNEVIGLPVYIDDVLYLLQVLLVIWWVIGLEKKPGRYYLNEGNMAVQKKTSGTGQRIL